MSFSTCSRMAASVLIPPGRTGGVTSTGASGLNHGALIVIL